MAALCSAGVRSSSGVPDFLTLPRFAGVIWTRYLLFGANTPWKRVRLTLGRGTKATSLDMAAPALPRQLLPALLYLLHPCSRAPAAYRTSCT